MFKMFKQKPATELITYSHWDIHALARVLDPTAWKKMDEAGIHPSNYNWCPVVTPSFDMAVNALLHGVRLTEHSFNSHEEVAEYFQNYHKNNQELQDE